MIQNYALAALCLPAHRVGCWPAAAAEPAPDDGDGEIESGCNRWKRRRMTERVGTVEHRRRRGAQPTENATAEKEIAHESLAARNELVGEDVPRAGLESACLQQRGELRCTLRTHLEVVLENDALTVEQEALAVSGRMVEQLVDERDETLAESNEWVIPLAIPVCVRDDVSGKQ